MRNKRGDSLPDRLRNGTPPDLPDTECWEWTSYRNRVQGYGRLHHNGKDHKAHRVSYALANGPIPDGLVVRHKCDNPPCVNPAHLELGTQADNVADRVARSRGARVQGTANGRSKLTEDTVREIRTKHAGGGTINDLAIEYEVSVYVVWSAVHRKTWKHVD